ncbi:MAG: NAD(P)H-dependent glycerol-3-phosphate dehydrogenase [Rhodospirillales bacterium]
MPRVTVIGAGAWGTALALVARQAGNAVALWAHDAAVAAAINATHRNPDFLPGVALPADVGASPDIAAAAGAEIVLLAVPAQFLRANAAMLRPHLPAATPLVVCAKGIEQGSGALMSAAVADALPGHPIAVLSGPTFAAEVARGLPTAVTLACADATLGARLVDAIGSPRFRPYVSEDVVGAQVGGAVKNVIAIACGIAAGRALGENARAALITRGLAEMTRLCVALGGRAATMMGLSGLGDLTLTCTSAQSRNYSLGAALGKGEALAAILAARKSVAEGVYSASAVVALAARHHVEMPIAAAVTAVVDRGAPIDDVIGGLLSRPFRAEGERG